MSNTTLPPSPSHHEAAVGLRHLALALMDAADLYDEGRGEEGERCALEVAEQVRDLVNPQPH